jgi:hypothetical protein
MHKMSSVIFTNNFLSALIYLWQKNTSTRFAYNLN